METIEQKVKNILKLRFSDDEIEIGYFNDDPEEQIYGRIVSEKFEGLDTDVREEMIRSLLRTYLTSEERQRVLSILDYTPAEQKFYSEAFDGPPREKLSVEGMKIIEQKVKDALNLQFTDEEMRFDDDPGEIISGVIVSEKFWDLEFKARQELIWNLLEAHLTPEEQRQVAGFQAFTPEEQAVRSEFALAYPD